MESKKKRRVVDLLINGFTKKGNGLGTASLPDGRDIAVEVPFAIPQDNVSALLLGKRQGRYQSLLEIVSNPSPDRIPPRCLHFGSCGGCRWQQISYEQQLALKEKTVRKYFAASLTHLVDVRPVFPCSPPWQYRNKMEFSFSSNKAKDKFLGLVMDSSRGKVFNLTECHLVNPWFAEAAAAVRAWWESSELDAYHPLRDSGSLRTLTLREGQRTGDRLVMLTVSGNADYALKRHHIDSFVRAVRESVEPSLPGKLAIFLKIHQAVKGIATNFYEMHLYGEDHIKEQLHVTATAGGPPVELTFKISPSAFFQPNSRQAEQLYSLALQAAGIPEEGYVYDLYCGTGTLGICAANKVKKVLGIELSPESALDAKENAARNGCSNIEIVCGSVPEVLKVRLGERPDLVMVDPPRAGLDPDAIACLSAIRAKKILYISCNPETQAANVNELIAQGYKLKMIQPVDQFPHTVHVENIAVLEC